MSVFRKFSKYFILIIGLFFFRYANAEEIQTLVDSVEASKEGMSLWQIIQSGGVIMIVLGILSIVAGALIIYNFLVLKKNKLIPKEFADSVIDNLDQGKINYVSNLCRTNNNLIAIIVYAGLSRRKRGVVLMREAIAQSVKHEVGILWQNISYLADIASIAPLIGLLGTVLGMIQAFNVVAFQSAVVKPILLAGGVSKAMVTTAGGLVVAIPVMIFYSYFRAQLQEITNIVETYSTDVLRILEEVKEK